MSYLNVWIHMVWSTKFRFPYLNKDLRIKVIYHIFNNARAKGIHLDMINGYTDHLHALISLKPEQSLAKTARLIKGESACWINQKKLTTEQFSWQKNYFAVSINPSEVKRVREYICNQPIHHQKIAFADEYQLIIKKYGRDIIQ